MLLRIKSNTVLFVVIPFEVYSKLEGAERGTNTQISAYCIIRTVLKAHFSL
jgi:hypothetical protein